MSTPVGEQPSGTARAARRADRSSEPVTVEQVLARQAQHGGRAAPRDASSSCSPAWRAGQEPPRRPPGRSPAGPRRRRAAAVRQPGLPPVPDAAVRPAPRAGPPVPVPSRGRTVAAEPSPSAPSVPAPAPPRARRPGNPTAGRPAAAARSRRCPGSAPPTGSSRMPTGRPRRRRRPGRAAAEPRPPPAGAGCHGPRARSSASSCSTTWASTSTSTRRSTASTPWPPTGRRSWRPRCRPARRTTSSSAAGSRARTGAASVATLLASVSADGSRAVLVSFPPTALVDTPDVPHGGRRAAQPDHRGVRVVPARGRAVLHGARRPAALRAADRPLPRRRPRPGCRAWSTRSGGCRSASSRRPRPRRPPRPLPDGLTQLSGDAATGYLQPGRDGSDVTGAAVAERAQRLLTSTLRAAMSTGTLADPLTLTRFLNRAADALTVDQQTTLGDLRVLAGSLGDLSGDAVQRAALPVAQVGYVPAGTDQAYVLLDRAGHALAVRRRHRGQRAAGGAAPPPATSPRRQHGRGPRPPAAPRRRRAEPAPAPAPEGPTVPPASVTRRRAQRHRDDGARRHGGRSAARRRASRSATVGNEAGHGQPDRRPLRARTSLEQARTVAAAVPGRGAAGRATRSATPSSWSSAPATRPSSR